MTNVEFGPDLCILSKSGEWGTLFPDGISQDAFIAQKCTMPGRFILGWDYDGGEVFLLPIKDYEAQMRGGADFELYGGVRVVSRADFDALNAIGRSGF